MISEISTNVSSIYKLFNFSKENSADINKKLLLEMAKNGEDKPNQKTKLGQALKNYTSKSGQSYDPVFTKQIKKLRPDWFVNQSEIANEKKKLLLEMAKNGEDRPNCRSKLGQSLISYTRKSSKSYDPVFTKQIKKLRPDWFISKSGTANQNKKLLLEMAKNGEDRPNQKTKLGQALKNYTSKSGHSYDPVFTKQIKKTRPDWFKND